ncbi:MAG: universal stress protein [Mangrovicoccus sp.]
MEKLIALVDGSTYSASVCDAAAWAAGKLNAEVTVCHVLGHRQGVKQDLSGNIGLGARTALLEELAELDAAQAKLAQKRGRAILEDAKARIEEAGVREVAGRLRHGDLFEMLGELTGEAEMLIIGKRGEAADYAREHLGSNFERVIRTSTLPVLVAAREFKPVETVVIAFDGNTPALRAVDFIARNPLFMETTCHLIYAGQQNVDATRKLDGALALLRGAGLKAEPHHQEGAAEEVIPAKVSELGAELVVMGAYSHSRMRGLIMGSTTSELVRACHVPVLLVR